MRVMYDGKIKKDVLGVTHFKFFIEHNKHVQTFYITEKPAIGSATLTNKQVFDKKFSRVDKDVERFVLNHCFITEEMRNG